MSATYNPWLVALSLFVAVVVSYTALTLAGRVANTRQQTGRLWLVGGAVAMGVGIWSMHFIGMLAYSVPLALRYNLATTLLSLATAVLTSGFALTLASRADLDRRRLAIGSLAMGAGIATMHYTGMAAIMIRPAIHYRPALVTASIAIAVSASYAALWLAFRLRRGHSWLIHIARVGAAAIMGLAITGMHYTGMAATLMLPGSYCTGGLALDNSWLAVTVGLLALGVLAVALVTALYDARLEYRERQENRRLRQLATRDSLTGLANRTLLEDRLCELLEGGARNPAPFSVLLVDLDRFKQVNDALGHRAGDQLLREVALRLGSLVRSIDTVARVGGDQFALLLHPPAGWDDAEQTGTRINAALAAPFRAIGTGLNLSASIGIVHCPLHGDTADGLLARAETAMHHAKDRGRNTVLSFTLEMENAMRERLGLENDLRRALELRQFELHYQPKIDHDSGDVRSAEALLRWHHPARGTVPPEVFIPVAEASGLIHEIGAWVLREACHQARSWQTDGLPPLRIAVNVSPSQFHGGRLFDTVSAALTDSGLAPQWLEIELTESTVMSDPTQSVAALERLSRMGVLVSVDDFGTGYSSMSHLRRFPIDKLKIDRSFIKDLAREADDVSIVQAIISLAHSLRLKVVAEGVENVEQLRLLQDLGCDQFQGFHFSPPLCAADFADFVRHWRPQQAPEVAVKPARTRPRLTIVH